MTNEFIYRLARENGYEDGIAVAKTVTDIFELEKDYEDAKKIISTLEVMQFISDSFQMGTILAVVYDIMELPLPPFFELAFSDEDVADEYLCNFMEGFTDSCPY